MRFALILAAGSVLAASASMSVADYQKWRADYDAKLKAPGGWLAVAGLYWLHDGSNSIQLPNGKSAAFELKAGQVRFENRALKPDMDSVKAGDIDLAPIERGGKIGIRLRDPNAETRRTFTGTKWFPASTAWRIDAKWVAYPKPKPISITNILGMKEDDPSPGYAGFTMQGKPYRLDAVIDDDELFFMFKDATAGHSTYGAGRFLYASIPKGDRVELDFNKAHNPPCAFTAFATCPLPPKQNVLPLAIEAGEKSYGAH
jgi:uncharacterized protein (DUF1684 family)